MSAEPARKMGKFTYSDYLGWPDEERWEIIDGQAWDMSPSPTVLHQSVLRELFRVLLAFFERHPCQAFVTPLDVVLSSRDVVQPDILVVCEAAKIQRTHIAGAPDLVIEILSPSSAAKDRREKFGLYERHGVREYLIVHPEERLVEQFVLGADGRYALPTVAASGETVRSAIFEGLEIDLGRVFTS